MLAAFALSNLEAGLLAPALGVVSLALAVVVTNRVACTSESLGRFSPSIWSVFLRIRFLVLLLVGVISRRRRSCHIQLLDGLVLCAVELLRHQGVDLTLSVLYLIVQFGVHFSPGGFALFHLLLRHVLIS